jgi:hypothetical protein
MQSVARALVRYAGLYDSLPPHFGGTLQDIARQVHAVLRDLVSVNTTCKFLRDTRAEEIPVRFDSVHSRTHDTRIS